jgi:hypothetical protein
VAADEAFAKIRIYGIDLASSKWPASPTTQCVDFNEVSSVVIDPCEFAYPSDPYINVSLKQYSWSALCRKVASEPNLVQITVFVSRRLNPNLRYRTTDGSNNSAWPMPVRVGVSGTGNNELTINSGYETFINDGCTIVDNATGRIYRVLERYKAPDDKTILLDRNWEGGASGFVWVVPPPVNGGRYPCIAVYQKVIRF